MKKKLLILLSMTALFGACKKEGLVRQSTLPAADTSKSYAFNTQVLVADSVTNLAKKTTAKPLFKYLTVYRERYDAVTVNTYVVKRVLRQVAGEANFGSISLTRQPGDFFLFVGSNDTTFQVGSINLGEGSQSSGAGTGNVAPGKFSIFYYKAQVNSPDGPVSAPSQLFTFTTPVFDPANPVKTEQLVLKCAVAKVTFTLTDAASQDYKMVYLTLKNGSNNLDCSTNTGFRIMNPNQSDDQVVSFKVPANGWHGFTGTAYFFSSSSTPPVLGPKGKIATAGTYVYFTLGVTPTAKGGGPVKTIGLPDDQLVTNTAYSFSGSIFSTATQPGYTTGADTSYKTAPAGSFAVLPKENFKIVK